MRSTPHAPLSPQRVERVAVGQHEIAVPVEVERLDADGGVPGAPSTLRLAGDRRIRASTIVIASSARYRRPPISNLADFDRAGVSY